MSTFKTAQKIIEINRDTLGVILVYSGVIALLSLAIPISVQTLINVVSFGTLLQPIVVLTCVLFIILSVIAGIRIAQAIVVETIQQRVFANIGIKLAKFLPTIELRNYNEYRVLELVNHFFEVATIQKALATLLITGIEVSLLAFFSMLLVAFYHPLLLVFDILLIISLILALRLPWKKTLKYSLQECENKHRFVSWLEEIIHNIFLFKMQDHAKYALDVADNKISDYLLARKKHFSGVLKHIVGINLIYVIANAALLGIGGYLVVIEQLSLGQLVASELIINALLYGVVRFSFYMEDLYDLLASCAKVNMLFNIASEQFPQMQQKQSSTFKASALSNAPSICATDLAYYKLDKKVIFKNLNFKVASGHSLVFCGKKNTGKSLIIDIILGFCQFQEGILSIDEIPVKDYDISQVRHATAMIRNLELFPGTIYENLIMQRSDVSTNDLYRCINQFKFNKTLEILPDGLNTYIHGVQNNISKSELQKIIFIRAILAKPSFLLIDGVLDRISDEDVDAFIEYLKGYCGTLIITTQNQNIANHFKNVVYL